MTSAAELPTDIAALQALLMASEDRNVRKEDRIVRLEKLLADFKRALYGAKSEKGHPNQYHLVLEDIETAMAIVHAEDEAIDPPKTASATKPFKGRGVLPKHLPRIEEIIVPMSLAAVEPSAHHSRRCQRTAGYRARAVPCDYHAQPKYACRSCEAEITQAPAKPRLIEGGAPTEAPIASVIVSKYADHLPLYRQSQIYARQGVDIDRSTLAFWVGKAAHEVKPVHDALLAISRRRQSSSWTKHPRQSSTLGVEKQRRGTSGHLPAMIAHGTGRSHPALPLPTRRGDPANTHQIYCRASVASYRSTAMLDITAFLICVTINRSSWRIAGHTPAARCMS